MAVRHGYGKIAGTDALVFAYDTGDIINCYKGEPTTNVVNTNGQGYNPLDLYTWAPSGYLSTWSRDPSAELSPVGGIPLKEVSSGTDAYSDTYNNLSDSLGAASAGQTWTVSVYAKSAAGTNLQLWLFEANSNGNYIALSAESYAATGNWQRIALTRTLTDGSTAAVQARVATATNGAIIWWDGLQMEQKPYATQFTPSARSSTQGLLDLTGNRTIELANVSFTNQAQPYFDGTDDVITFGAAADIINKSYTIEAVFNRYSINRIDEIIADLQYNWFTFTITSNNEMFMYHRNIATYIENYVASPTGLIGTGYCHAVGVFDINAGMRMYVNGNLVGSNDNTIAFDLADRGPQYIGQYRGGAPSSPEVMSGQIPILKIYSNKALTAGEVLNNYNNYKTRFNLP
jgi:hypothetical protein